MDASIQTQMLDFLCREIPGMEGAYLFGSRADDTAGPHSDYDIAFLTNGPSHISDLQRFQLAFELADILNASVDLVDLQAAHTDFRFVIISTGKRIFCRDEFFCDSFEMMAYSMYQYFEEERRYIIEDIKKRGSVYG